MKSKLFLNSTSGVAQVVVNIALLMITIPIFINKLGVVTYGIYALITAIGSLGVFTNFGFNTSLIKYLAEQGRKEESSYDIIVTFLIIGASTTLIALIAIIFNEFILMKVLVPSLVSITPSVRWFYIACVCTNIFQMLSQIPSAIIDAQQKVYITNAIQLGIGVLNKCCILLVLFFAPDLMYIGWALLLSSGIGFLLFGWFALRTWGGLSFAELGTWFVPITQKHFSYGRSIYATSLMTFFYEPLTKVLISRYIGLAEVGFFDLALRIRLVVSSIWDRLLYPVFPMLAQISNLKNVRDVIKELQQKVILVILPTIILAWFITGPIIELWIGKNVRQITISVMAVVCCNLLTMIYQPVYFFLIAKGHPGKTFILQSVNVVSNILLFWMMVPFFKYYGALAAFCIALLSSVTLCAWYQWKYLGSVAVSSGRNVSNLFIISLVLFFIGLMISLSIQGDWQRIVLLLLSNLAAVVIVFRTLNIVDESDILRYIGANRTLSSTVSKILIKGTRGR